MAGWADTCGVGVWRQDLSTSSASTSERMDKGVLAGSRGTCCDFSALGDF